MSDLENLNVMKDSSHYQSEESDFDDLTIRPYSQNRENSAKRNSNSNPNSRRKETRGFAWNAHSTSSICSNKDLKCPTGEINYRITLEPNGWIDSFNLQIQNAKKSFLTSKFYRKYKLS